MKRIFKTFPLFLCVIMVSVFSIFPAQAYQIDENTGRVIWSDDELIQFGMVKDSDGSSYFPAGTWHPDILYAQSTLFVDEPFFPGFDLMKLPWESFPQPVRDILNMSLDGYNRAGNDFKIPFVLVRVSYNTTITVYVGTNLGIGRRYNNTIHQYDDMIRICSAVDTVASSNSVCYMAQYRLSDYSPLKSWQQLSPVDWGSSGKIVYYDATIALGDRNFDFYIYGGLGIKEGIYTGLSYDLVSDSSYKVYFHNGGKVGYHTYFIFPYEDDYFSYWKWFYPPTADELAAYRQQQIIDVTGNADTMTTVDSSSVDDYHSKEEELVSKYDPDNLSEDVKVEFDSDASYYIFNLLTNIVESDSIVFGFVISALSLGVISLILNR